MPRWAHRSHHSFCCVASSTNIESHKYPIISSNRKFKRSKEQASVLNHLWFLPCDWEIIFSHLEGHLYDSELVINLKAVGNIDCNVKESL